MNRFRPQPPRRNVLALAALLASVPDVLGAQATHPASGAPPAPQLYENLGDYRRPIATAVPLAQRWFDQGLRWMFDFNLEEAQASFGEAARLDPRCAVCQWGVALSLGPHINLPGLPERTVAGARAAAEAKARLGESTPAVERALVEAIALRYSDPAPADVAGQRRLDQAYADAMRGVATRFPNDADVLAYTAEAIMNLWPWDLWSATGEPRPDTGEILELLERALARSPDHPLALHLKVHALESSPAPERALAAADRLAQVAAALPHLVHMPSHIYFNTGDYRRAAAANQRAIRAAEAYQARARPQGFYLMYVAHNHQLLWAAEMMAGRSASALAAARGMLESISPAWLRTWTGMDLLLAYPHWTLMRFGRTRELLLEPLPPEEFTYAAAMARVARGLAQVEAGALAEAERELAQARALAAKLPPEAIEFLNSAQGLAAVGLGLLAGEIACAKGDTDAGLALLRAAAAAEDALRYDDPPDWYLPVRPFLGARLLALGRAAEAQAVFEEDLGQVPENGWSLAGLAASLERLGKPQEAATARARFAAAWADADVPAPN